MSDTTVTNLGQVVPSIPYPLLRLCLRLGLDFRDESRKLTSNYVSGLEVDLNILLDTPQSHNRGGLDIH